MGYVYSNKKALIESVVEKDDIVLDVGFWGQAVKRDRAEWPHRLLKERAKDVYGVDLAYDESALEDPDHYKKASAEQFDFEVKFDVIFASEVIEHLSNPGLFLDSCARNLQTGGRLVITTPNAFSLFTMLESMFRTESVTTNPDHTLYFNIAVLKKLLEKNGWEVRHISYLDTFRGTNSLKRRVIFLLHRLLALFTNKFMETLVVIAKRKPELE